MAMFNPFKDYFYYTKSERNGTVGLLLVASLCFTIPSFYSFIFPIDYDAHISYCDTSEELAAHFEQEHKKIPSKRQIQLTLFNPNTATAPTLHALGLTKSTTKAIINYRNSGGVFRKPSDLKKIYTLSAEDYRRIKAYIQIPSASQTKVDTSGIEVKEQYVQQPLQLFHFDPNTIAANRLRKLGLSHDAVNNILRYRAKGGKFYNAESMRKIYGLSQRDYERIEPYVKIKSNATDFPIATTTHPDSAQTTKRSSSDTDTPSYIRKNPRAVIDVNLATAEEWQQLRGIGAYYAQRIVKFRNALGGFSSIEQIGTTYGLKPATFESMRSQLKLSPILHKIDINRAEMEDMSKHPYLKWHQAQTIYNYRIQHGHYSSVDDLLKTKVISAEHLERLRPYLSLDADQPNQEVAISVKE